MQQKLWGPGTPKTPRLKDLRIPLKLSPGGRGRGATAGHLEKAIRPQRMSTWITPI